MEVSLLDRVYKDWVFVTKNHFLLVRMVLAWSGLLPGGGKNKLPPIGRF